MTAQTPPHPVDLHVGARIRLRRKIARISQIDLAAAIGVTFQQIQKYESGSNRISASSLHAAAMALRTPIAWFFEGLPMRDANPVVALMTTREGWELARLLARTPPGPRRQVLALVRGIAEVDDPGLDHVRGSGEPEASFGPFAAGSSLE